MKTNCFFIIAIFLLLISSLTVKAQTSYSFEYDASGNRLIRSILLLKGARIDSKDSLANQKTFEDLIGNRPVKIYPNPTKGLIKVEIPYTEEVSTSIQVFSNQGALIKNMKVTSNYTEIDLSSQPVGIYILRIGIEDQSSEWKIIKD